MTRRYLRKFRKESEALAHEQECIQERSRTSLGIVHSTLQAFDQLHPVVLECLFNNPVTSAPLHELQWSDAFVERPNKEKVD